MTELSEEEIKTLKEVAQNFQAASRVGRIVRTSILWLVGLLGGGVFLWDFVAKFFGKS